MHVRLCAALAILAATFLAAAWGATAIAASPSYFPPQHVSVLPIFFVPTDQKDPTSDEQSRLLQHLTIAQSRYHDMLGGQDTFDIAQQKCLIYHGKSALAVYKAKGKGEGASEYTQELLDCLKFNRLNCPYVLLMVVMSPDWKYPNDGGRPLNGGVNTGGGVIIMSSSTLDANANFQSTLQHELGHSFGLVHVDMYGYDMDTNESIMSYNKAHHSNGFQASADPGILIPEDLRLLALNHRVFPKFTYRVPQDVPSGYQICPNIAKLGPMDMPDGFPYRFDISTPSGNAAGSTVKNLATGVIKPDKGPGITFDKRTMWQSDPSTDGWVFVNLKFPDTVTLTSLTVHSEHSGKHHRAVCLILEVMDGGKFREVCAIPLPNSDALVQVPKTSGQVWRLRFQAGPSHVVALRGLQFFSDDTEIFPPLLPPEVFGVPAFTPAPNTLTPN